MEYILTGIFIAIGFYIAPIVLALVVFVGAFFFEIYQDSVSIIFSNDDYIIDLINVMGQGSRINNVYQAVVEFIQLYNKANKSLS